MVNDTSSTSGPGPFRRPVVIGLAAALVLAAVSWYFMFGPTRDDPAPSAAENRPAVYMPAEFDHQEDLLLGGSQLAELHPQVLADMVAAAVDHIGIRILSGNPASREKILNILTVNGLDSHAVEIVDLPLRTMWVRDFGPVTVRDATGRRSLVGFHYRERRGNALDDEVPGHLADEMGLDLVTSPLLVEGGDFLSNGRGLCLMSTRVVNRNAHYLELEPRQTVQDMAGALGFESVSLAPPLQGETTGHVDMFCVFLAPDLVVVGRYDPAVDPDNAAQLDGIATNLAGLATLSGPLRVERIPMPDHDDGFWRTYTNVVFANGVLLVPVYPAYCPDLDETALAFYRGLLPDRKVVGIDTSELIKMNGALRCLTMNVPGGSP